jgi:hypothetical protein
MSVVDLAAKYGELDGLFKKYCEKKKKESKLLRKQLEDEIATNVELRKYIALLESKLINEKDNVAQLERLNRNAMRHADEATRKRDSYLRELTSDLSARLLLVEQRERECAERAAALELREEQFWLSFNNFEKKKAEFEAGLSAYKKTMTAELQHSREAVDVAKDCLCDIRHKGNDITEKERELEDEVLQFQQRMYLELEERSLRDRVIGYEFEVRCSLFGEFFHEFNLHQKLLLSKNLEKESQLQTTTDLLHLHEVEFSTRVRKEKDLCKDERSKAELMRREFALECRSILHDVSDLLDAVCDTEMETARLGLEAKLHAMLQQSPRNAK